MVRALVVAALLVICGSAGAARADAEADALIEEGVKLRAQKKDAEALALFEQAYAQSRSPRALGQIALAEQALGRWLAAEKHLTEALAASGDPWIASKKATLEGSLAAIGKRLARVELSANADGATAKVEGAEAGALPRTVRVVAGKVRIEVRAPGHTSATRVVEVAPEATEKVAFTLSKAAGASSSAPKPKAEEPASKPVATKAASAPPPDPETARATSAPPEDDDGTATVNTGIASGPGPDLRTWAWVAAGSGGGALLIGVILVAAAEESDTDCSFDDFTGEFSCANPAQSAGIGMIVLGGLLGATAGVLFAVSADDPTTTGALPASCDLGLAAIAGADARGASCAWRF